ncbi:hypothetical protein HUB97_04675 [Halorubraceae archaeon YAN]|nr:hypothetical protein [Halorubraceae archaeon YAN]
MAATQGRRLGTAIISIVTLLYGLTWIVAGLASHSQSVIGSFGPFVGIAVVLVAVGLWLHHPVGFFFTLALYGAGTLWTLTAVADGETDQVLSVIVGMVVVGYLLSIRAQFTPQQSATDTDIGTNES